MTNELYLLITVLTLVAVFGLSFYKRKPKPKLQINIISPKPVSVNARCHTMKWEPTIPLMNTPRGGGKTHHLTKEEMKFVETKRFNFNKEKAMNKDDLKPMMRVQLRDGTHLLVCDDSTLAGSHFDDLIHYRNDLTRRGDNNAALTLDIMKVFSKPFDVGFILNPKMKGAMIWERALPPAPSIKLGDATLCFSNGDCKVTYGSDTVVLGEFMINYLQKFRSIMPKNVMTITDDLRPVKLKVGCLDLDVVQIDKIISFYKKYSK